MTPVCRSENISQTLRELLTRFGNPRSVLLTDSNVARLVLPTLNLDYPDPIIVPAGEGSKSVAGLGEVWHAMLQRNLDRKSILICLGGGVVTDLGGFAAATYKRGIRHINIPTTVLGAVDAAIGGKTGIDFDDVKNLVGAFHDPVAVIVSAQPLSTLPHGQILSGYGEIVKAAMLTDRAFYSACLTTDPVRNRPALSQLMERAMETKDRIVSLDPHEQGLRKVLNLGHTAGHALESLMSQRTPVSHGEAVAHGLGVMLILSRMLCGLPGNTLYEYFNNVLRPYYHPLPIECRDYQQLWTLMCADKKNRDGQPRFVLLKDIGQPEIDVEVCRKDIEAAFDIYRDLH